MWDYGDEDYSDDGKDDESQGHRHYERDYDDESEDDRYYSSWDSDEWEVVGGWIGRKRSRMVGLSRGIVGGWEGIGRW